jgi:hypothetical protein
MKNTSVAVLLGLFALYGLNAAAETPVSSPVPSQSPLTPDEKAVQTYGDDDKTCGEWTDGCLVCVRSSSDPAASCSLPGIACQPHTVECKGPIKTPMPQK